MRLLSKTGPLIAATAVILGLSGCASSDAANQDDGLVRVVASTSVYGDIAGTIGGDRVTVTSIISDPAQDPHSFEADARVQLALAKADLVIENGGGYDDFIDTLLNGSGNQDVTVLNAVEISGLDQHPANQELNEHVWYNLPTVQKVADRIAQSLTAIAPASSATFTANAATFTAGIAKLVEQESAIKSSAAGSGVAITEPVPLYLLQAVGLVNKTPAEFSEAIEAGIDMSPLVLKETLDLFQSGAVKLLVYNEQTSGPETEQVLDAAKAAGVAVVPVTEILPPGKHYLDWMSDNLTAVAAALH